MAKKGYKLSDIKLLALSLLVLAAASPLFLGGTSLPELQEVPCQQASVECWQDRLFTELARGGLDSSLALLAELYRENPRFAPSCHYLMHNLGLEAYKYFLKDKNSVISAKASSCGHGFYHGFMQALLGSKDIEVAQEFCNFVREKVQEQSPDAYYHCYHGIGHGAIETAIIREEGFQDEGESSLAALRLCEEAAEEDEELYRCASGVFNGIANFYITGEYGLKPNPGDPLELCRKQLDKYKESCYGNFNSLIWWLSKGDLVKSLTYLEPVDEEHKESAARYLSGLAAIYVVRKDPQEAVSSCRKAAVSLQTPCIQGFVDGLLEHGAPSTAYEEVLDFCRNSALTDQERSICFEYLSAALSSWYSKVKVEEICGSLPQAHQVNCRRQLKTK